MRGERVHSESSASRREAAAFFERCARCEREPQSAEYERKELTSLVRALLDDRLPGLDLLLVVLVFRTLAAALLQDLPRGRSAKARVAQGAWQRTCSNSLSSASGLFADLFWRA